MSGTCLPAYCAYRMQGRATVNFAESQTLDPVPSIPGSCVGPVVERIKTFRHRGWSSELTVLWRKVGR